MLYMKTSKGAYQLMRDLAKLGDGVIDAIITLQRLKSSSKLSDSRLTKKINYLLGKGYVKQAGKYGLHLTDLGKINMLNAIVRCRVPDGKIRLVIFDVPEKMKTTREAFRRHLVNLGFTMEQKSVWSNRYPCEDLVNLIVSYHNLNKHVSLIVGDVIYLNKAIA